MHCKSSGKSCSGKTNICSIFFGDTLSCGTFKKIYDVGSIYCCLTVHITIYIYIYIAKELTVVTCVMQSSSYELNSLVSSGAKCKQPKAAT